MALEAQGKKIYMDEYDFGRSIPFTLTGKDILPEDTLVFTIRRGVNSPLIVQKTYKNDSNEAGTFMFGLSFTKEESRKLPANDYVYSLVQYRGDELRDTILDEEIFKVKEVV